MTLRAKCRAHASSEIQDNFGILRIVTTPIDNLWKHRPVRYCPHLSNDQDCELNTNSSFCSEIITMGDAEIKVSSWRLVEVGRVVLVDGGASDGKLATIVEIIDHKRVRSSWNKKDPTSSEC